MKLSYSSNKLIGQVQLPTSKSMSNRILLIQHLTQDKFEIDNLSEANDTQILVEGLSLISHSIKDPINIDVQDAGTPFRFLVALIACSSSLKNITLLGTNRLHQRPIADLVEALKKLGAEIEYLKKEGFPPLLIQGKEIEGGEVVISGKLSSQFISALCLIAPKLKKGLQIQICDSLISATYVEMTLKVMAEFGSDFHIERNKSQEINAINIKPQQYHSKNIRIEADWSSATLFFAMAMIHSDVEIFLPNLNRTGFQGDEIIMNFASLFGIESCENHKGIILKRSVTKNPHIEHHFSLQNYPDLAIPLIVACAISYPKCTFEGIHHLTLKESNRIEALQKELIKVNIHLKYEHEILSITKQESNDKLEPIHFTSHKDHRIVMALSLFAIEGFNIYFDEVECVKKSYPNFFKELQSLGFQM